MKFELITNISEALMSLASLAAWSLATIAGCLVVLVAIVIWQQWRDM